MLSGYDKDDNIWTTNVICGILNHGLCQKLDCHLIVCHINATENKHVFDMTFIMVHPKNMLATLKRKISKSV